MWVGLRCPKAVGLRKRHAPNLMSWLGGTFGVGVQAPVVSVAVTVLKATRLSAIPSTTATVCGMVRERFMGLGVLCGRAHNPCDHACSAGPSADTSSVALFQEHAIGHIHRKSDLCYIYSTAFLLAVCHVTDSL